MNPLAISTREDEPRSEPAVDVAAAIELKTSINYMHVSFVYMGMRLVMMDGEMGEVIK